MLTSAGGLSGLTTTGRRGLADGLGRAVLAALFTTPGARRGGLPTTGWRRLIGRTAAVAQLAAAAFTVLPLAVPAVTRFLFRYPEQGLFLACLTLVGPVGVVAPGRPLTAWRCALAAEVLCSVQLLLGYYDTRGFSIIPVIGTLILPTAYLYWVGTTHQQRVLVGAWLATAAGGVLAVRGWAPANGYLAFAFVMVAALLPGSTAAFGHAQRTRRLAEEALAEQEARTMHEQAARAVLEERSRIARELHDVVAHHMSVIAIHAETAPYQVANPPTALTDSFAVIRASAVEALSELRRLLVLLRSDDGTPKTAPQPGLAQVDDLVAMARGSGCTIEVRTVGLSRPLSSGVDLSAFRIVQEAISNALRHAPGATVWVDIEHRTDTVGLIVYNNKPTGRSLPVDDQASGSGHGLLGMRERVTMLGGTLITQPTPDGGFLVKASLPIEPTEADADGVSPTRSTNFD